MFTFKVTVMSRSQASLVASWTHTHADYGWIWEQKWYLLWGNPWESPLPHSYIPQVICGQLPEAAIQVITVIYSAYILSVDNLHYSAACTCVYVTKQ